MLKNLNKLGIEGTYLKIIRAIYEKPTVNIILNGKKLEAFPLENWHKTSSLTIPIQHSSVSPCQGNQEREKNKKHPNKKKLVKLFLFAYNIILYLGSSMVSSQELLKLINNFSKVSGYKINVQKPLTFL